MRKTWIILMALSIAGSALAQVPGPKPGEGDPKAPPRKATPRKDENPGPRTGPGQSGSPDANKVAPADPQKQPK